MLQTQFYETQLQPQKQMCPHSLDAYGPTHMQLTTNTLHDTANLRSSVFKLCYFLSQSCQNTQIQDPTPTFINRVMLRTQTL